MCPRTYPSVAYRIPALVDPGGKPHVTGKLLNVAEPSQIPQFAQYATGHYGTYARYTAQEHIVFLVVFLGPFAQLDRYVPELPVDEPEAAHAAFKYLFPRWVREFQTVQPVPERVAPVVVVELLRDIDAVIEQLHLDVALDLAHVLDKVVPSAEQASQLFPLGVRDHDALQTAVLQFTGYQLRIYSVRLCVAFLSPPEYVRRVHHQRAPAITLETTMGTITATAGLVRRRNLVVRIVTLHIFP